MRESQAHGRVEQGRATRLLLLLSVLACALLAARVAFTDSRRLLFLPWNLFLAWVPFGIALATEELARRIPPGKGRLVLPAGLWLLFLPNAPYILTDVVHLRASPLHLLTFDAGLILLFAAVALTLGLRSLAIMHQLVEVRIHRAAAWTFVGFVLVLTGTGVWMGRVVRLNSWDVFTHPLAAARRVLAALESPGASLGVFTFSVAFAIALLLLYLGPRGQRERS